MPEFDLGPVIYADLELRLNALVKRVEQSRLTYQQAHQRMLTLAMQDKLRSRIMSYSEARYDVSFKHRRIFMTMVYGTSWLKAYSDANTLDLGS